MRRRLAACSSWNRPGLCERGVHDTLAAWWWWVVGGQLTGARNAGGSCKVGIGWRQERWCLDIWVGQLAPWRLTLVA